MQAHFELAQRASAVLFIDGVATAQDVPPKWLADAARFHSATGAVPVWYVQAYPTDTNEPYHGDRPDASQRATVTGQDAPLDSEWPKRRGYPLKSRGELAALLKATDLAAGLASAEWPPSLCDNAFFEQFQRAARSERPLEMPRHVNAATIQFSGGPDDMTYLTMRKWATKPCELPEISASVSTRAGSAEFRKFIGRLVKTSYSSEINAKYIEERATSDLIDACLKSEVKEYGNYTEYGPSKLRPGGFSTNGMLIARCQTELTGSDFATDISIMPIAFKEAH